MSGQQQPPHSLAKPGTPRGLVPFPTGSLHTGSAVWVPHVSRSKNGIVMFLHALWIFKTLDLVKTRPSDTSFRNSATGLLTCFLFWIVLFSTQKCCQSDFYRLPLGGEHSRSSCLVSHMHG